MADYQITVYAERLKGLLVGDEELKGLVEEVLNQVLEAQVAEQIEALPYERTENRKAYRNGYRTCRLYSRVGPLVLRVPQLRGGEFSTEIFCRYQRSEQALVLAMMEMVLKGVSTRKVAAITEELCGTSFSKSTVSGLCAELDGRVRAGNERSLEGHEYPFVVVDAMVIKAREDEAVRPVSALTIVGINEEGHRELLGLRLGNSESEAAWQEPWPQADLPGRGQERSQGSLQGFGHGARRQGRWRPPDSGRRPGGRPGGLVLPEKYRLRLRTTNMLERLHEEIRRRERVIRIFPNERPALRLIGALLAEQHE
jgi:transposase-like protein